MAEPKTLRGEFEAADAKRSGRLKLARDYAALTVADVLPPLNQDPNSDLPGCWTNTGGEGVENMVGRLLTSLFPVGMPWFHMDISAELRAAPVPVEVKNQIIDLVWRRELLAASRLEATNYRLAARSALESLIVTGNSLTRMGDDYDLRYYRFDNWTCKRSGSGKLLWVITKEQKHPSELTAADRAKAKIKDDDDELHDLFTRCKWEYDGAKYAWHIEQEIDGHVIRDGWETVNPYTAIAYRLCPGEDYSRGFISTRFPDIKSVNSLWQSIIFGMGNTAKMVPVIDPSEAGIRVQDLLKANGTPVYGKVRDGQAQGVAFLQTDKGGDLQVAFTGVQAIETRLGRSMLMETAAMPKGERVTATAVMRIAQELQGALGGPYAHIADELQKPLLERLVYQLERDALLPPIDAADKKRLVKVDILTGSTALAKAMQFDRLIGAIQQIVTLPGEVDRVDFNVIADRLLYYAGVDKGGILKSPEQVAAEVQAKLQAGLTAEAGKKAIDTIGNIVQERAASMPAE